MIGAYSARRTPLHALHPGVKLALLAVVGGVLVAIRDPYVALGGLALGAGLLASTLPSPRQVARVIIPMALGALLAGSYHVWHGRVAFGIDVAADLLAIVCVSLAVTASTSADRMLELVSRAARPLRRWIPPEVVGLSFSMMVRAIPETADILRESIAAARARGLARSPRAVLTPTVIRSVGRALRVGDAITARGLADFAPREASAR